MDYFCRSLTAINHKEHTQYQLVCDLQNVNSWISTISIDASVQHFNPSLGEKVVDEFYFPTEGLQDVKTPHYALCSSPLLQ